MGVRKLPGSFIAPVKSEEPPPRPERKEKQRPGPSGRAKATSSPSASPSKLRVKRTIFKIERSPPSKRVQPAQLVTAEDMRGISDADLVAACHKVLQSKAAERGSASHEGHRSSPRSPETAAAAQSGDDSETEPRPVILRSPTQELELPPEVQAFRDAKRRKAKEKEISQQCDIGGRSELLTNANRHKDAGGGAEELSSSVRCRPTATEGLTLEIHDQAAVPALSAETGDASNALHVTDRSFGAKYESTGKSNLLANLLAASDSE